MIQPQPDNRSETETNQESAPGQTAAAGQFDAVHVDSPLETKPRDDEEAGASTDEKSAERSDDDEDELPEYEPLTPELVEEEAIRGDFMLRWFLVLLAILLACTEISETRSLLHIASGRYLLSHGLLPPANDPFSYTTAERAWTNLSWLFDVLTAGIYSLAGATGLSVMQAVLAGIAFGLLAHLSRAGVSTWWGTACAALAAIACYPQFAWQPELITILGLVATLWLFHRWREGGSSTTLWLLVPLFVIWSNLDPRMFLGLAVLLLYASGEATGNWLGSPGLRDSAQRTQLWLVTGCCCVAAMLNPFGWKSLLAPISLYGVEYPALRQFGEADWQHHPLASPMFWQNLNPYSICGLLLMGAALGAFILNRRRLDLGEFALFLGFGAFVVAGSRELAAASLVWCVLATLNGQSWYHESVRQTYSVAMGELLFSRGGRALTVLALFVLAYLATSGRLAADHARRTGVGFEANLASTMAGLQEDLDDTFDKRPFNFELAQGDVLLFNGFQPFVDNRVALYAGGESNLLQTHEDLKQALGERKPGEPRAEQPEIWREAFNRYQITCALPRLGLTLADSDMYFHMLKSPAWQLSKLGSATAVFYRTGLESPDYPAFLEKHKVHFLADAFRKPVARDDIAVRVDWARPRSVYQKYLSLPRQNFSNSVRKALHYHMHLQAQGKEIVLDYAMTAAISHLVIRHANAALSEDPNNALAFVLLGDAFRFLGVVEAQFTQSVANNAQQQRRFNEAANAYHQALVVNPRDYLTRAKLVELYYGSKKFDLALESLEEYLRLVAGSVDLPEQEIRRREAMSDLATTLKTRVEDTKTRIQAAMQQQANVLALAHGAYGAGLVLYALELLEDEPNFLALNPEAQLLEAQLLLEAGRGEDATAAIGKNEAIAERYPNLEWRWSATLAFLANGQFESAVKRLVEQQAKVRERQMTAVIQSMPLIQSPRDWPAGHTNRILNVLYRWPVDRAQLDLNVALTHLESGQVDLAEEVLRKTIEDNPDTPLRRISLFYLSQITDEKYDLEPPADWIPISPDMFAPEEPQTLTRPG